MSHNEVQPEQRLVCLTEGSVESSLALGLGRYGRAAPTRF